MNTLDIYLIYGKFKRSFAGPSEWDEVPAKMAPKLLHTLKLAEQNPSLQFVLFALIYSVPIWLMQLCFSDKFWRRLYHKWRAEEQADFGSEQLAALQSIHWLWKPSKSKPLHPTKTLITKFRHGIWTYYSPGDRLNNVVFREFSFAESYYQKYVQDPTDIASLNCLVAVLYRRGHTKNIAQHGDVRYPLNIHLIEHHAAKLSGVPDAMKELIVFNYEGYRQHLAGCFKHVFEVLKKTPPQAATNGDWIGVAINMAGEDPQRFEAYQQINTYVVLQMLDNAIAASKKLTQ